MRAVIVWLLLVAAVTFDVTLLAQDARKRSTVLRFERLTGYPHGRPGFVVDHIIPLCGGGRDAVWNMQWQTVADAKVKDVVEKQECALLRAQKAKWPQG